MTGLNLKSLQVSYIFAEPDTRFLEVASLVQGHLRPAEDAHRRDVVVEARWDHGHAFARAYTEFLPSKIDVFVETGTAPAIPIVSVIPPVLVVAVISIL